MSDAVLDLESFFTLPQLDAESFETYADLAFASAKSRERFVALTEARREAAAKDSELSLRVGAALVLLGQHRAALEVLAKSKPEKDRQLYTAMACQQLGRFDDAIKAWQAAAAAGADALACDMQIALVQLRKGDHDAVEKLLSKQQRAGADRPEWYLARGMLLESFNEVESALQAYEKGLTLLPDHVELGFRAAYLYDLRGEDDRAIALYEQLAYQPRAYVNALINLAVVYEDRGAYDHALACLRRVVAAFPNHARARLFLRDVESSRRMVEEESAENRVDPRTRILDAPIAEFELSVRARNCLKKMRINTIGDLLKLTEAELMAYRNFGETSLNEIKAMLAKKGLRLGQRPDEIDPNAVVEPPPPPIAPVVPPGSEAVLAKPVAELELSVRARRCLQRLNIVTLADLIQHSEADLLATRNFGMTSLNEIKSRLMEFGLSLPARQP